MHERKAGTLKSGTSGKRVMSKKQAIGIGLPEARSGLRQSAAQKTGAKKPAAKRKSS